MIAPIMALHLVLMMDDVSSSLCGRTCQRYLAGAIAINLVNHVLHLPAIVVLSELHSHAVEVAEEDLVGVVVVEQLEPRSGMRRASSR
jgi:hypothetical protein